DWFLIRDYTPNEPVQSIDPYVNLKMRELPGGTEADWADPGGAVSWDVIRGQIDFIVESGTGVDLGPVTCIEDDSPDTTTAPDHLDAQIPPAGKAFFYLVRTRTLLDPGTYGHSTLGHKETPSNGDCF